MSMNIMALICLGYALVYFLCANGPQAFSRTYRNYAKRNNKESIVEQVLEEAIEIKHSVRFLGSVVSSEQGIMLRSLSQMRSMAEHHDVFTMGSEDGGRNHSTIYQQLLAISGRIDSRKVSLLGRSGLTSSRNLASRISPLSGQGKLTTEDDDDKLYEKGESISNGGSHR